MLTAEDIEKFKALYLRHYNIELSDLEALDNATQFLNLFKAVYRPIPKKLITKQNETKTTNYRTN